MRIGGTILDESERQVILMSVQCPQCGLDSKQETNFCIKCGAGFAPSVPPAVQPNVSANHYPSYRPRPSLITIFNIFGWIVLVLSVIGAILVLSLGSYEGYSYAYSAAPIFTGIGLIIGGAVSACFFFWMVKVLDLLSDIRDRG